MAVERKDCSEYFLVHDKTIKQLEQKAHDHDLKIEALAPIPIILDTQVKLLNDIKDKIAKVSDLDKRASLLEEFKRVWEPKLEILNDMIGERNFIRWATPILSTILSLVVTILYHALTGGK